MRRVLVLVGLIWALAGPALANWQFVQDWRDPIDGYQTSAATLTNADGYTLHLYRNPGGRVYALFTLPENVGALIRDGVVATLTPEGFDPKEIEARGERGRVIEYAVSTGRALRDRLWHGQGQAPAFGTFHDMLRAPGISVSFTLITGAQVDTTWSMAGAETPIAQALGISMNGTPAGAKWEDEAAQALLAAMTACQFPKLDVICVQNVSACSARISDERDIEGFEICVANGE